MYIITDNENVVKAISNTCEVDEEVRNIILDNSAIAYAPNEKPNIYDVEEIPEGVEAEKYCYTKKKGFYKNPDYVEYFSEEERISALEDAVNELILGGM